MPDPGAEVCGPRRRSVNRGMNSWLASRVTSGAAGWLIG